MGKHWQMKYSSELSSLHMIWHGVGDALTMTLMTTPCSKNRMIDFVILAEALIELVRGSLMAGGRTTVVRRIYFLIVTTCSHDCPLQYKYQIKLLDDVKL